MFATVTTLALVFRNIEKTVFVETLNLCL